MKTHPAQSTGLACLFLLLIPVAGLVLVFASQHDEKNLVDFLSEFPGGTASLYGLVVVFFAALLGSFPFFSLRYGLALSKKVKAEKLSGPVSSMSTFNLQIGCVTVITMLANVVSMPIGLGIAVVTGEELPTHPDLGHSVLWIVVFGGAVAYALPTIGWRAANLMNRESGDQCYGILIPIVSVGILAATWDLRVAHWDYFVLGTAAIVSANLLINLEAERLLGFKALVISLWFCRYLGVST